MSPPGARLDLRLAGAAVGCWLAALACLYLPAGAGALLGAVGVSSALVVCLTRVPGRWLVVGALIGVAMGALVTAARVQLREAAPVAALARAHATVHVGLTVTDDPRPVRGAAGRPSAYLIPATATRVDTEQAQLRLSVRILVLATDPAWRGLLPGTPVDATGRLSPPRAGDLAAGTLSVPGPPNGIGPAPWVQRAAGTVRAGLRRACAPLPPEPGGLLPGLVDGDITHLDPAVADDFRATGMTHLLAVSGANVAIVLSAVLLLARWSRAGPVPAAVLCGVALVGFVILVRPSPSVLRAAAMGGLGLLALALGRSRAAVPALAATVIALLAIDPGLANDAGFALSVFATAGLLLLAPGWRDALRRRGVPAGLAEALSVPAAAQVACAPVIAGISATVSLVAVPANLLAEPVVAPATLLGVGAAVVSPVWAEGAAYLAWLGSWPARWLVTVARYGAHAPDGVLAWPGGTGGAVLLAALLLTGLWLGRRPWVRVAAAVCALAAALGAVPVRLVAPGWPPAQPLAVVCDVGQGDAIVLPLDPGRAVVVDAGPDPAAVDRCLHDLGVREVPLLVVSHFHADHVGGVAGVFRGRRVGQVLTSPFPQPAEGRTRVVEAAGAVGTPVRAPEPGWSWSAGTVRLTLLGPVEPISGTTSDPNNNSLVLRADVAGQRLLLAGDAMVEEQQQILASIGAAALRCDVLKVAHHGSSFQDPGFLAATHPAVALVSVGAGNPYGHPNLAVLDTLRREGATVLRTDVDGEVAAVIDAHRLAVVRHGIPPGRHPP